MTLFAVLDTPVTGPRLGKYSPGSVSRLSFILQEIADLEMIYHENIYRIITDELNFLKMI